MTNIKQCAMNEYGKYSAEIAAICQQYGYKNCEKCPLFSACNTERQDGETQTELTERSEKALAEAYKKLQEEKSNEFGRLRKSIERKNGKCYRKTAK